MSVGIKDHPSLPIVAIVAIVASGHARMDDGCSAPKYQLGAAD